MIYGFLDPYVLVSPNNGFDEGAWGTFVERITDWNEFTKHEAVKTLMPDSTIELLGEGGYLPYPSLRDLLHQAGLGDEAKDFVELFSAMLSRIPTIQEELGIAELLLDELKCDPDLRGTRPDRFAFEFERLLAFMCVFRDEVGTEPELQKLLTAGINQSPSVSTISATLHCIEYIGDKASGTDLPKTLEGKFDALDRSAQVWTSLDAASIWHDAQSPTDICTAVEATVARYSATKGTPPYTWRLGAQFARAIFAADLKSRPIGTEILRACCETIFSENLHEIHHIRTNMGANAAQKVRGAYRGWRRNMNHDMHLHYWQSNKEIEFAWVTTGHDDLYLPT